MIAIPASMIRILGHECYQNSFIGQKIMILKGQKEVVERKVTVLKRTDGDKKTKVEFYLLCKPLGFEAQKEFSERLNDGKVDDIDLIRDHTGGWKGLSDAENNEIKYNEKNLAEVMDDRDYRGAMVGVALEAIFGRKVDFSIKN